MCAKIAKIINKIDAKQEIFQTKTYSHVLYYKHQQIYVTYSSGSEGVIRYTSTSRFHIWEEELAYHIILTGDKKSFLSWTSSIKLL